MSEQQLMNYFKFDAADLQANQSGQITEKQKARMVKVAKSGRISGNPFALFLVFIGFIGIVVAVATGISVPDRTFRIGFGLGFGCIWPLIWGGVGVSSLLDSSKHEFRLARVQGAAILDSRKTYDGSTEHTLRIGGKNFSAEPSLIEAMMPGAQYVVYYYIRDNLDGLVSTKNILSAELV
jgi:hypothetical protein